MQKLVPEVERCRKKKIKICGKGFMADLHALSKLRVDAEQVAIGVTRQRNV